VCDWQELVRLWLDLEHVMLGLGLQLPRPRFSLSSIILVLQVQFYQLTDSTTNSQHSCCCLDTTENGQATKNVNI